MVYICQFKDLEPLASKQVILSLQAYLNFVLWVFFCWQGQCDVTKPDKMLLLYHLNGLSNILCMENVLQVVQEIGAVDAELAVEDLLVLVDFLHFDHFPHQVVAIIDYLGLYFTQLFLMFLLFHFLLNLDDSLSVSVFLLLLIGTLGSVSFVLFSFLHRGGKLPVFQWSYFAYRNAQLLLQIGKACLVLLIYCKAGHSKLVVNRLCKRIGQISVCLLHFYKDLSSLCLLVRPIVIRLIIQL